MSETWLQDEGDKGGGKWTSKDGRRRHAERGADMCGGGWQGVGVDDVQVNGVPLRERK